jgi:hypothetical protein
MYNWFDALTVRDAAGQNPRVFFQAYGTITMTECQAHATTYVTAADRAAQNSMMTYHCISDSLTTDFKAEFMAEADLYTILGYSEGLCFLKLVVSKAQVDTIATVNMLRASITGLRTKMVEISGNIIEFNNYVKHLESTLFSYGERSDDLLMNVFLAYGSVEDEDFVLYIKAKRNNWEEHTLVLTVHSLMHQVENYCKVRIQQGNWMAPSKKDEQIMALKAMYEKKVISNKGENTTKKSRDDKAKADKLKNPWKYTAPKQGEPTTKDVEGFTWHWCGKHQKWAGHKEADCQGVGVFVRRTNKTGSVAYTAEDDTSTTSNITNPTVQVNKALLSVYESNGSLFD